MGKIVSSSFDSMKDSFSSKKLLSAEVFFNNVDGLRRIPKTFCPQSLLSEEFFTIIECEGDDLVGRIPYSYGLVGRIPYSSIELDD